MKFTLAVAFLAGSVSVSAAAVPVEERALPIGHPIIDNEFLPANYTLRDDIYPSGFAIPTETLTGIPSGYSIGPTGVYGPDGATVTAFPPEAIAEVAVQESTDAPAESSLSTATAPDSSSAAAETTSAPSSAFKAQVPAAFAAFAALIFTLA